MDTSIGGVRIVDMPDLGAVTDNSSFVGEHLGSGRFSALALARYATNTVRSYGAVGDGVYDDTGAIQAAVSALAGACGAVFFPAGTYRITAPINIPPCVSLYGVGAASKIAQATAGQVALSLVNATVLDNDAHISDLQIAPTADNCIGISATNCRYLKIHDVTFTGCAGNSIALDRCEYYAIRDCYVRDSMSFLGGTVLCQSSVWNSVSGGYLGGNGTIERVRFSPLTGGGFDNASPCIHLISQPTTSISHCYLAWGAFGNGPVDFIILENQCQGNVLTENIALGVRSGITIQPGTMANAVMPSYITMTSNAVDSFGGVGIGVFGTAALPATSMIINDNTLTEPQQMISAAAIAAPGAGYSVNDLLFGPAVPAPEEGAQVILQVTAIGGGGTITGTKIYNAGLTQLPTINPVAFTGGTGSGAQFNLTYFPVQACLWLANVTNSVVSGNISLTYGGIWVGYGIALQSVSNTMITDNHITELETGIYCIDAACSGLLLANNFVHATNDFGGTPPTVSIFQDNIGIPWVTTTPAMPASGVAVTNTAPYPQQIIISGGTVTGFTYLALPVPATTASGPIILNIRPQHTISITYSVAPAWNWIPML